MDSSFFFFSFLLFTLYYFFFFFFFNDTATTEIYTLSLHDALPILSIVPPTRKGNDNFPFLNLAPDMRAIMLVTKPCLTTIDRKSTRLNSSHSSISYAVFCLKKKKKKQNNITNIHSTTIYNISMSTP